MELVAAWKESLSLLRWQKFKLFLLVTLKSIIRTYRLLFTYWWWLIGLLYVLGISISMSSNIFAKNVFSLAFTVFAVAFQIVLYLSCRPSVLPKDANYFRGYKNRLALLVGICVINMVSKMVPFSTAFCTLWALFALDQKQGADSLLQPIRGAAAMLFYNLPLFVVFGILILIAGFIAGSIFGVLVVLMSIPAGGLLAYLTGGDVDMDMTPFIYSFVFLPIEIATVTNLYTKKLHDQSDLYFPQP